MYMILERDSQCEASVPLQRRVRVFLIIERRWKEGMKERKKKKTKRKKKNKK